MGLKILRAVGQRKNAVFEGCHGDMACIDECPEKALFMERKQEFFEITIDLTLFNGVACNTCETVCSEKVFDLFKLITSRSSDP